LLHTLPDTPERAWQELEVQTTLSAALMATEGYTTSAVEAVCARTRFLCQHVHAPAPLFSALLGLWRFHLNRGELPTAYDLSAQLLTVARRAPDPHLLVGAYQALGCSLFFLGEFAAAHTHVEQGIALSDAQQYPLPFRYGLDVGVLCRCHAAIVLWVLGYSSQALARGDEGLTLAHQAAHPLVLVPCPHLDGHAP
jgi:predicted ATPase